MRAASVVAILAAAGAATASHAWGGPTLAAAMCKNAAPGVLKCVSSKFYVLHPSRVADFYSLS